MMKTGKRRKVLQFTSCKGVFQGGGCKGFAYVGAYKAAVDEGVVFTEVCGTSAGSIFASFIAAGASPEQLRDIVDRMDPEALFHIPWCRKGIGKVWSWFKRGHIIDPVKLEYILNEELAKLLNVEGTICFYHLKIPLTVIASDLYRHTYVEFSSVKTPHMSVAHAVVCSSAFTYFFKLQDNRYTDGGIVSNMPAFALKTSNHFDKILAFNLLSEETTVIKEKWSLDLFFNVVTTITNANVDVQSKLVPKCYVVPIDVKEYGTLDFKKINDKKWLNGLISKGEQSARDFFKKNQKPSLEQTAHEDMLNKSVEMRTQISLISLNEDRDLRDIYVLARNTIWARELFPLLLEWFQEGIHVEVYCENNAGGKADEEARRRMLRYCGCEVFEVQGTLPVIGYFVKRKKDIWEAIISNDSLEKGRYYHLSVDKPLLTTALKSITANVSSLGAPFLIPGKSSISLKPVPDNTIISMIQNERLYQGASLSYELVEMKDVRFLTKYILNYKYINIDLIYQLYKDADLDPFSAAAIALGQKDSLVGPPVLEEHEGNLYVIEGNTRCFYSMRNGIEKIEAIVVRNVYVPLPTTGRYKFEEMILTDNTMTFDKRYNNPNDKLFRHIERCLRPSDTYLI